MPCLIDRSKKTITTEQGVQSSLYKSLYSIPTVLEFNQILASYKSALAKSQSNNVLLDPTDSEPVIFFSTPEGKVFSDYKKALDNATFGKIQVGVLKRDNLAIVPSSVSSVVEAPVVFDGSSVVVNNKSAFIPFLGISVDSSDTPQGFINKQVRLGNITSRSLKDGSYSFNTGSSTNYQNATNSIALLESAPVGFFVDSKNEFKYSKPENLDVEKSLLDIFEQEKNEYLNTQSKDRLRGLLLNSLDSLGISVISLEDYNKRSRLKTQEDVTLEGLVDFSESLVALNNGSIETLSEEASHIFIEAYKDRSEINELLKVVDQSEEYKESFELYNKIYNGDQALIRKEVLGKLLAKTLQDENVKKDRTFKDKLLAFLNKFLNIFNQSSVSDLQSRLRQISRNITSDPNSALDSSLIPREGVMYSAYSSATIEDIRALEEIQSATNDLITRLREQSNKASVQSIKKSLESRIKNLRKTLDRNDLVRTARIVQEDISALARDLNRKLVDSEGKPNLISTFETVTMFEYLYGDAQRGTTGMLDLLNGLKGQLNTFELESQDSTRKNTIREIDSLTTYLGDLRGRYNNSLDVGFSGLSNKLRRLGAPDNFLSWFESGLKNAASDTNLLFRFFGTINYSSKPILSTLGVLTMTARTAAHNASIKTLSPLIESVSKLSISDFERFLIERDDDGKMTGFAQFLYKNKDRQRQDHSTEVLKGILEKAVERYESKDSLSEFETKELDEIKEALRKETFDQSLLFDVDDKHEYEDLMEDWDIENTETYYNTEYLLDRRKRRDSVFSDFEGKFSKSDIKTVQDQLRLFSQRSRNLRNAGGKFELEEIDRINIQRKQFKSLVDKDGTPKSGQDLLFAEIAIELDKKFRESMGETSISEGFLDAMEESDSATEFFANNGGVSIKSEYFESEERKKLSEGLESPSDIFMLYEGKLDQRSKILSQYRSSRNPSEIRADLMPDEIKQQILEIQDDLSDLYISLPEEEKDYLSDSFSDIDSVRSTNDVYKSDLATYSGAELDFIVANSSSRSKKAINVAKSIFNKISKKSKSVSLPKGFISFYSSAIASEELNSSEIVDELFELKKDELNEVLLQYARTKLPSFYKRSTPPQYNQFKQDFDKDSKKAVKDLIEGKYENIEITFLSEWAKQEDREKNINQRRKKFVENNSSLLGNYPIIPKFTNENLNQDFWKRYGIVGAIEDINVMNLVPRSNAEDFNVWKQLMDISIKSHNTYNSSSSRLQLPQVRQQVTERVPKNLKDFKTQLSEGFKDVLTDQVDDLQRGERDALGREIRAIPMMYTRLLKNPDEVSKDALYSYSMLAYQSELFKGRNSIVSDVMALENKLLQTKFLNGKAVQKTHMYNMFQEFVGANLFGIKQSYPDLKYDIGGVDVDLGKLLMKLNKWVQLVGTGLSPIVALTGGTSSYVNKTVENVVGENLNRNSSKWARSKYRSMLKDYMLDIGVVNKKSELHLLKEYFGITGVTERVQNSGFPKTIRWIQDHFFYGMAEAVSDPFMNEVFLSNLDNFRFVETKSGKRLMNYQEFKQRYTGKADLDAKWESFRKNSVYNSLEKKGTVIDFKDEIELTPEEKSAVVSRLSATIQRVNATIDGSMPQDFKSAARRHAILNFTTNHRSWLVDFFQRRFSSERTDFYTGQKFEGTYKTMWTAISKGIDNFNNKKSLKAFIETFEEEWNDLDNPQKRYNMVRTMTDLSALIILVGLGYLIKGVADDEENKDNYLLQLAAFIHFRTISETASSQILGSYKSAKDVIDKPIMAMDMLYKISNHKTYTEAFDTVDRGVYKGYPNWYKTFSTLTQWRNWHRLRNTDSLVDYRDTYMNYNKSTLFGVDSAFEDE